MKVDLHKRKNPLKKIALHLLIPVFAISLLAGYSSDCRSEDTKVS